MVAPFAQDVFHRSSGDDVRAERLAGAFRRPARTTRRFTRARESARMPHLPPFRLEAYFETWEFTAHYHLCASDAQTLPLADLLALGDADDRQAWERLQLGYIETRGTRGLRDAIAATYETIDAEQILCFAGAEEGLYCAMHAVLEPGDHAVVLVPNYQSMETVPASICAVTGIALREHDGWALDLEELEAALRPNTRLVAVNFPNNPTGKVPSEQTFRALAALCDRRGIVLFSDEVYRGLERDSRKTLPQAADLSSRALSLNVLSKAYGLPGLRVGWIASRDRDLLTRMARIKEYLSICNAAPSEVLATIALKASAVLLERNLDIVRTNLALWRAFFAGHTDRFTWDEPDGGCTAFPQYLGSEGVERFCEDIVRTASVLLLPASLYRSALSPTPGNRFRIGYGRLGLEEGLQALETFLRE